MSESEKSKGQWKDLHPDARYFFQRADAVADQQRKGLVALHISALGALFAATAWFASQKVDYWPIKSGLCFFIGLVMTNISYALAKSRAKDRAHCVREDKAWPVFPELKHSSVWEWGSLVFFVIGVALAVGSLPGFFPPATVE